ncbi:hypothetical protein [Herbaspirillum rhizosphaerae]|uniref:hypothetical protein n=1 Tax=Herbaspirillum rhizosphaerae TaxID=346179 RepID=UPI0009F90181|nr:hypothetical protein [Herbaspirillum rhizosphaerae]
MAGETRTDEGLAGRDCVPFFSTDEAQIKFEFWYLVAIFLLSVGAMLFLQFGNNWLGIRHDDKLVVFAYLGGFLGGWVYDTKWFYRVTARGKNNQYPFRWQPHKFYWRVLTPFLSGLVALATFFLATSDFLPISIKHKDSARAAFATSFLLGYFSDLVLSRLAAWAEKIIPKSTNHDQ